MQKFSNTISALTALFLIFFLFSRAQASETIGSIDSDNYKSQICENEACTMTSTSTIFWGNVANKTKVVVNDSGISGYIWIPSYGMVALDCEDTSTGCTNSAQGGNFKVSNTPEGKLSGLAYGEFFGWINFGPFKNSSASQVVINNKGEWNGYAWSADHGWIKFDCSLPGYCVKTDWRPAIARVKSVVMDVPAKSPEPQPQIQVSSKPQSISDVMIARMRSIPEKKDPQALATKTPTKAESKPSKLAKLWAKLKAIFHKN
ncbi:MAG: hypothetical protein WCK91_00270 [bacterium]